MSRRQKKKKEAVVPAQDKRICGGICLCQLTIVLSCVALVYLTVVIYMPSYRAFTYGLEESPVMCQTVNSSLVNNCDWYSCGEWCLTKSGGQCAQIEATARRNGTHLHLVDCNTTLSFSCPPATTDGLKKYNCNKDKECATIKGVFNCSKGHCLNISEVFLCHNKPDGRVYDNDKESTKLNGFYYCDHSKCKEYKSKLPQCDRYCTDIQTTSMNVFLLYGNNVFAGNCKRAVAYNEANGNQKGTTLPEPKEIWSMERQGPVLVASCHTVDRNGSDLVGTDCINGTILEADLIPKKHVNFTQFWSIVRGSKKELDPSGKFLPAQSLLTIHNKSRLLINLDACVNTLKGECATFIKDHWSDGDNDTAQARFPCFYHKEDPKIVVTRFDLKKTWFELMIAVIVPSTLFAVSFVTLIIIGHSVYVGDDAKMRCVCAKRKRKKTQEEINAEVDLVMDGIIERTNAISAIDLQHHAPA